MISTEWQQIWSGHGNNIPQRAVGNVSRSVARAKFVVFFPPDAYKWSDWHEHTRVERSACVPLSKASRIECEIHWARTTQNYWVERNEHSVISLRILYLAVRWHTHIVRARNLFSQSNINSHTTVGSTHTLADCCPVQARDYANTCVLSSYFVDCCHLSAIRIQSYTLTWEVRRIFLPFTWIAT